MGFEAVIAVCLLGAADAPCRDVLLPGAEAATRAACEAGLADLPAPRLPADEAAAGAARCRPAGEPAPLVEAAPGVLVWSGPVAEPDGANGGQVANSVAILGAEAVAVVDPGGAAWAGEALWRAIRARTPLPVRHVILTHMHPDHVFGAAPFVAAGAEAIGAAGLGRALADREASYRESLRRLVGAARFAGSATVLPDREVTGREEIDLGGRVLVLEAWPVAHTPADLTVTDTGSGLLIAGDLVFDRHVPALDGALRGWIATLDALAARAAAGVVPGHGAARLDWPRGAAPTRRYLAALARDVEAAIARGARIVPTAAAAAADERDDWALFDAFNPRNATAAYTELEWE